MKMLLEISQNKNILEIKLICWIQRTIPHHSLLFQPVVAETLYKYSYHITISYVNGIKYSNEMQLNCLFTKTGENKQLLLLLLLVVLFGTKFSVVKNE